MIMWYLAVALLAARLKLATALGRRTAPESLTAQLAAYRRTAEGIVIGRHRPEYVASFA